MNAAKHYIYKSKLKSSYFLLFNHLRNYKLGSLEIKNFQKNMQSKCVCHPKMPRIKFISYIMVGQYTLLFIKFQKENISSKFCRLLKGVSNDLNCLQYVLSLIVFKNMRPNKGKYYIFFQKICFQDAFSELLT